MSSTRLIATLLVPVAGAALLVGLSRVWQGGGDDVAALPLPAAGEADASSSSSPEARHSPAPAPSGSLGAEPSSPALGVQGDPALAAVAVLQRFCRFVDHGLWVRAGGLLVGPWVWPWGELRAFIHLRFRSARRLDVRLSDDLVFLTRVRAQLARHSVLHGGLAGLHNGVTTLVFTLGRGGTDGGWLITAVSTRP